jgi:hypothetical protein
VLRLRGWLAGLWAGALLAIALIAAPAAFAQLERAQAGRVAGRLFETEAYVSLALAVALVLLEQRAPRRPGGSRFSVELALALGALACTVAGYFAVQPMMAAALAGSGPWSFAALHTVASVFYAAKTMLVLVLAWRGAGVSPRPSS